MQHACSRGKGLARRIDGFRNIVIAVDPLERYWAITDVMVGLMSMEKNRLSVSCGSFASLGTPINKHNQAHQGPRSTPQTTKRHYAVRQYSYSFRKA